MSTSSSNPHWLFDLWRRRRNGELADAADVGTAFGLELTMIPEEEEAALTRAAVKPRAGNAGGASRWLRRLMRRREA